MFHSELGKYLREKRIDRGLSQKQVSEACGLLNGQFISNIERGSCATPPYMLAVMVELYKIRKSDFLSKITLLEKYFYREIIFQ
jgi:transcriptional regulator with XRE-family HTH domain